MRAMLELHARCRQLRHLGRRLHPLLGGVASHGHRAADGRSCMTGTRSTRLPWLLLISIAVVALDRWSKIWVRNHVELGQAIPVIPKVFRITHVLNDGAAFSLFADSASPEHVRWVLIAFSTLAAVAVLV